MATVLPIANKVVTAQPQGAYYTVSIDCSGFLDTETNKGGRISPCVAEDFATQPTTLAQSRLVSRGALRFKMMCENLALRTNFRIHNIVTTYSSDAGDTAISTLAFGLVFDNRNFVPNTGTNQLEDSTTINTRALYIKDRIADALNSTRTENMNVYDPTTGSSDNTVTSVTAGPVLTASIGEIAEAITVTEVTGFAPLTANQLVTDNALTYSSNDAA